MLHIVLFSAALRVQALQWTGGKSIAHFFVGRFAMTQQSFCALMAGLARQFGLTFPGGMTQDVYTLDFDGQPRVHFIGRHGACYLDVLCEAGTLVQAPTTPKLLDLLKFNGCDSADYSVGITFDASSGTLLAWSRQRLEAMDAASLQRLVQCVRLKAAAVRQWADTPEGYPAATRSGDTLSRLLLSNQRIQGKAAGNARGTSPSDDNHFSSK